VRHFHRFITEAAKITRKSSVLHFWPIEKHCESLLLCKQQKLIMASAQLLQPTALL